MSVSAWLTIESRPSHEACRLEGLLLRVRVDIFAAPKLGAVSLVARAHRLPGAETSRSRSVLAE